MALGFDGSIRIDTAINTTGFTRGIERVNRGFDGLTISLKKFAVVVAAAFGVGALVKFGKEAIKASSDLSNAWMGLNSIVEGQGKSFSKAKGFINDYISDGLVPLENAVTAYKNLASRGYSTDQIEQVMDRLKDAAAFGRQSSYSLGEAVATATEGLRQEISVLVDNSGVTKNVAKMWEEYAASIGKTAKNLTQQEKIQAEVNGILEETKFQIGDAAKLAGIYSGQIAMLSFNFQQLKVAVGDALIPIARAVLPGINAIIAALTKLANMFAKVTALLFGKSTKVVATNNKEISSTADAAAKSTDDLSKSLGNSGKAAKKAAEEAETAVAAFDEFNILSFPDKSGSGSSGGGGGGAGDAFAIPDVDDTIDDYEAIQEEFETLGDIFAKFLQDILDGMPAFKQALLDFADSFNKFNKTLYDAFKDPRILPLVEELGRELADALNGLVNAIDWNLWGRTLGAGLNLGLQFLTEFLYNFDWITLGRKLAAFINGLVAEVDWYDFGRLLWAGWKIALETLAGFLVGLDMPQLARAASDIIKGFFTEMKNTLKRIPWYEIGKQIAIFLNNIDWIGIIKSIAKAFGSMVDAALELIAGFIQNANPGVLIAAAALLAATAMKAVKGELSKIFDKFVIPIGLILLADSIQDIMFGHGLTWKNILEGAGGGALVGGGLGFKFAKKLGLTWAKGMIGGAVIGIGISLLIESVADIITKGLNIGNSLLGAIGGAIAGAAAGFLFLGGPHGAILGASIGLGVSLLIESITDVVAKGGLNAGNSLLGMIGAAIAGAVTWFSKGWAGGSLIGATVGIGISLLIESITDIALKGINVVNGIMGMIGGVLVGAGVGFAMGGPGGAIIGAVVGAGLTVSIENIVAQITGGLDIKGAIMTVVGTALAGAGIGFAIGNVPGAIAGAVIGLVAGVAIEMTGISISGNAAYKASEDFQTMTRVIGECEEASERSSRAMEVLGQNIDNLSTSLADVGAAESLVQEIYEINDNANASAYELEQMKTKVELLNSMSLGTLHLSIDETTGRIVETREATDRLIESLKKEAETAALQQLLVQAYKDRYTAVADAEKAVKDINVAEQALAQTEKELTNTPFWDLKKRSELRAQEEKQTEALKAATEAREQSVLAYDQLNSAIDTYSNALTGLDKQESTVGATLEERMGAVRKTVEDVAKDMPGYGENIGKGLEKGMSNGIDENKTKGLFSRIGEWFQSVTEMHSPSKLFERFGNYLVEGLIIGIKETWSGILEFFQEKVNAIVEFFNGAWDGIREKTAAAWEAIKDTIGGIWDSIIEKATEIFEAVVKAVQDAWEAIKKATSDVWDAVNKGLDDAWKFIKDKAKEAFDFVLKTVKDVWDGIKTKTDEIWGAIQTFLTTLWENLKKTVKDVFDNVLKTIKDAWDNVKRKTEEIWNNLKRTLEETWTNLKNAVIRIFGEIKKNIVEAWENIKREAIEKWNDIKREITDKIEQIKKDVKEGFGKVKDFIIEKVQDAIDALKNMDWFAVGKSIVDGIFKGLFGIFDKLKNWAKDVWNSVTSAFNGGSSRSGSFGSSRIGSSRSVSTYSMASLPAGYQPVQLPKLANGAVIPPNQQFMAILGDQRSGVNVEAPLSTIETALQNVMDRNGGMGGNAGPIEINLMVDKKVLARVVVPEINNMTKMAGKSVLLI